MASVNGVQPTIDQNYAVQTTSPNGTTALVGTASVQVITSNPARRGIVFFNPGTVTIYVCPANQTAVSGQGVPILPGGQQEFIGDGKLINYNCAWNAIAASGANNPLTMLELL